MTGVTLETDRLILRPWREADRAPFAALNADPCVMRYFPATLSREESDALILRAMEKAETDGICFQPVEEKASGAFLGFVGLNRPAPDVPVPDTLEIGWRLARYAWGQGYATEAAMAWLRFGFETLRLREIISFTAVPNAPSRRVMKRLGMTEDTTGAFGHPAVPEDHPLRPHVLYRLSGERFNARADREGDRPNRCSR
ncbi:GNAT family N-acetyltransferase [Stappia sp. ES.058]|uniref:GNAT family N-acetyltransferase n=1 Tax=Stappia sp. ES.058 TaxID=1881061 RepID=UPI00087A983A|nr:GNAT family N-acetyltransferase [Stappia sp. ES.058]SDU41878.1 Protein N-acetyltransferase, RimJ/RimL family [Stappia sp. ES.058]